MNTALIVESLKYLTKFKLSVSIAKWIYEDLSSICYNDTKLQRSFKIRDYKVSESIIKWNQDKDMLNAILFHVSNMLNSDLESNFKLLIDHGADVNTKESIILDYVILHCNLDKIKTVLKFNPKISLCAYLRIECFHDDPVNMVLRNYYHSI